MTIKQSIKRFVIWLVLILVLLELGFHYIDPYGLMAKNWTWRLLTDHIMPDPTGYAFEEGVYHGAFTATILGDHSRLVSDSNWQADCKIAFIGDSFTFGYGVNDNETFVNLIAGDLRLNARNFGVTAYNADQVWKMRQQVHADGYIYLHIDNDYDNPKYYHIGDRPAFQPPMFALYEYYHWQHSTAKIYANDRNNTYLAALNALARDPKVLTFAFNEKHGTRAHNWYPSIILIDTSTYYEHHVSIADWHPNREGHRLIADTMEPYISDFVSNICKGQ